MQTLELIGSVAVNGEELPVFLVPGHPGQWVPAKVQPGEGADVARSRGPNEILACYHGRVLELVKLEPKE